MYGHCEQDIDLYAPKARSPGGSHADLIRHVLDTRCRGIETKTQGRLKPSRVGADAKTNVSREEFGSSRLDKADGKKEKFLETAIYFLEYKEPTSLTLILSFPS